MLVALLCSGFSYMNMELLQILHYGENDEYDFHYDYTASDANIPSAGNRIFTFFLYLNDLDLAGISWDPTVLFMT